MPRVAPPPEIPRGSLLREFRVKVGTVTLEQLAEATGATGFTKGKGKWRRVFRPGIHYMILFEDPPDGMRAPQVPKGRWWTRERYRRAQRAVALLWSHAEAPEREWLRGMLR